MALTALAIYLNYSGWRHDRLASLELGSRIIETTVGPIEYSLTGGSDQKTVLLFIHGTPGGYDQARSESSNYRTLTPSRPGYLRTPIGVGRSPADQAHAYAALLDALGIATVIVMGESGGGPSAISFALIYPERTRGLIALEAVTMPMEIEDRLPGFMRSDFLYWAIVSAGIHFQGVESLVSGQIPDAENQYRILSNPAQLEAFTTMIWSIWPWSRRQIGFANDLAQMDDLDLPLSQVKVPTLIVHGTADVNVPISHSQFLSSSIPQAEFQIIEGADHNLPLTHVREVEAIVDTFISGLPGDD